SSNYNISSESLLNSGFPYYISPEPYNFQDNDYNTLMDDVDADDESFEYYSVCDNNMVNEALTEENNETLTEENNKAQPEIHSDDDQQSDDELNDSECEEQMKPLVLNQELKFETWKIAEAYLDDYAKQQDLVDNTITRRWIYECSYSHVHQSQKVILEEDRRERDSKMIG
ncbi:4969_t:CDS:2, partial [Racocetra fulgida]